MGDKGRTVEQFSEAQENNQRHRKDSEFGAVGKAVGNSKVDNF